MLFRDREDAGERLAAALARYRGERPLVLAVPRGALPMGRILADALDGELDVVLVHKIGAPENPEYAIGAVGEGGEITVRAESGYTADDPWVRAEAERQLDRLAARRAAYTPGRGAAAVEDRVVIVVDDGVATGATLAAALALVRRGRPRRLVAAVGVAPVQALHSLRRVADEVVCLATPDPFFAVGQFYDDFRQVTDEESLELLARRPATSPLR
jgi:putative phosphoribosyl transferase